MRRFILKRPLAALLSLLMVITMFTVSSVSVVAGGDSGTGEEIQKVSLAKWDANRLEALAQATGTKNADGNPVWVKNKWPVGVERKVENATTTGYLFSDARINIDSASENYYAKSNPDVLWPPFWSDGPETALVVMYFKAEILADFSQAAGVVSLVEFADMTYSDSFLITQDVIDKATPAPDKGEGFFCVTWKPRTDVFDFSAGVIQAEKDKGNKNITLQLRAQSFAGNYLAFHSIEMYRVHSDGTKYRLIRGTPSGMAIKNDEDTTATVYTSERMWEDAIVSYLSTSSTVASNRATLTQEDNSLEYRKKYTAGTAAGTIGLTEGVPVVSNASMGRLGAGNYTLKMNYATYGSNSPNRIGLVVYADGEKQYETIVKKTDYTAGQTMAELAPYDTDSGQRFDRSIPFTVTEEMAGADYTFEILTYNNTDMAIFGLELFADLVWQDDLGKDGVADGHSTVKSWDHFTLAEKDGDYTSFGSTGKSNLYQYEAQARVPVGIEYYMANGATMRADSKEFKNACAPIKVDGIDFRGITKLTVDAKVFTSQPAQFKLRVFDARGTNLEQEVAVLDRAPMYDANWEEKPEGYLSYLSKEDMDYDATYNYPYKPAGLTLSDGKGWGFVDPNGIERGQSNAFQAKIWPGTDDGSASKDFVTRYGKERYLTLSDTDTMRIYEYRVVTDGKEVIHIQGEDWVKQAEIQNAMGNNLKARVVYAPVNGSAGNIVAMKSAGLCRVAQNDDHLQFDDFLPIAKNTASVGDIYEVKYIFALPNGMNGFDMKFRLSARTTSGNEVWICNTLDADGGVKKNLDQTYLDSGSSESFTFGGNLFNCTRSVTRSTKRAEGKNLTVYTATVTASLNQTAVDRLNADGAQGMNFLIHMDNRVSGNDYDFAKYPIVVFGYEQRLTRGTTKLAEETVSGLNLGKTSPYGARACSMEPVYENKLEEPSSLKHQNATAAYILPGKEFNTGKLTLKALGNYLANLSVKGESGDKATLEVFRHTPKEGVSGLGSMSIDLDGTEQSVSFWFDVQDLTDQYSITVTAGSKNLYFRTMSLTAARKVKVDNVVYPSLNVALEEAEEGQVVTLLGGANESSTPAVVVPKGITLDLNGKVLDVKNLVSFGQVVDGAVDQLGCVRLADPAHAVVDVQEDNETLPVYNSGLKAYRFFDYTFENAGTKVSEEGNKVVFGYFLKFEHPEAYSLLGNGNSRLAMDVKIRWTGSHTYHYEISPDTISGFGKAVQKKLEDKENPTPISKIRTAITLTIGGVNLLGENGQLITNPTLQSGGTGMMTSAGDWVYSTAK